MLQIRPTQIRMFADVEVRKFEDWTVRHIRTFFPNAASGWNDEEIGELIRYGLERALAHGIRSRSGVCKYIDLMVAFGRDFDTDPGCPWAESALRDWHSESGKVEALFRAGLREEAKRRRAF